MKLQLHLHSKYTMYASSSFLQIWVLSHRSKWPALFDERPPWHLDPRRPAIAFSKSHHNQRNRGNLMTWWYFEFLCQKQGIPMESYGYLSKIIKNIGKTREDYHILSVKFIQVLSPKPLRGFFGKTRRLLCQLILQGEAGAGGLAGSIISNSWDTKVMFFHWEMHDNHW